VVTFNKVFIMDFYNNVSSNISVKFNGENEWVFISNSIKKIVVNAELQTPRMRADPLVQRYALPVIEGRNIYPTFTVNAGKASIESVEITDNWGRTRKYKIYQYRDFLTGNQFFLFPLGERIDI